LHLAVGYPRKAEECAQFFEIGDHFFRCAKVWVADNLDKRHPCAVVVNQSCAGAAVVDKLARVGLYVDLLQRNLRAARVCLNFDKAVLAYGREELRKLVARRQIGVEVIFLIEGCDSGNLAVGHKPRGYTELDGAFVRYSGHPRHPAAGGADILVWLGAEFGGARTKQL
jgi:hypothetical protein